MRPPSLSKKVYESNLATASSGSLFVIVSLSMIVSVSIIVSVSTLFVIESHSIPLSYSLLPHSLLPQSLLPHRLLARGKPNKGSGTLRQNSLGTHPHLTPQNINSYGPRLNWNCARRL